MKMENLNETFHASKSRTSNFVNLLKFFNYSNTNFTEAVNYQVTQSKLHEIIYQTASI